MTSVKEMKYERGRAAQLVGTDAWRWFVEDVVTPRMEQYKDDVMSSTDPQEGERAKGAYQALEQIIKEPEVIMDTLDRNIELESKKT